MQRQLAFKLSTTVETSRKKNLFFFFVSAASLPFLVFVSHFEHFQFCFPPLHAHANCVSLQRRRTLGQVLTRPQQVPPLSSALCVSGAGRIRNSCCGAGAHSTVPVVFFLLFSFFVYKIGKKGSHFCFITLFGCVQHSRLFFFFLPLSLFHAGQMFASFGLFFFFYCDVAFKYRRLSWTFVCLVCEIDAIVFKWEVPKCWTLDHMSLFSCATQTIVLIPALSK